MSSSKRRLVRMIGPPTVCYLCGAALRIEQAEADHVEPKGRGGTDRPENLRWACQECNRLKAALPIRELLPRLARILRHQGGI
jgi:5-methylcytosine-specific restriction endonuclease McrA